MDISGDLLHPVEDFWSRQANAQTVSFHLTPLGIPARITANRPELLPAAYLSTGRFSPADKLRDQTVRLQLVVQPERPAGPLPPDWPQRLVYAGLGPWISLSLGEWGHGFANLDSGQALAFLSSPLAAETRLVSRYVIDHYLLNFILRDWAMLHASTVLDPTRKRLIVMIGPHNTGKSTTALLLVRAGYTFVADGMLLLRRAGAAFQVSGYPLGEVKLRDDVLALFPEYQRQGDQPREQGKTVIKLRAGYVEELLEQPFSLSPGLIHLCFVERGSTASTRLAPLSPAEADPILAANTVYWDEPARLVHNRAVLQTLLQTAHLHRLQIGTDAAGIGAAIAELGG